MQPLVITLARFAMGMLYFWFWSGATMVAIKPLEWVAACPPGLTLCSLEFTLGGCHRYLTLPPPLFFCNVCEVFVAVLHHCCWCDMLMSQRHGESTWVWAFLRSTYVHGFQHFTRFISSLHVILATRQTIFEHHLRFHCTCVIYRIPGCLGSLLCTICGHFFCRHGSPPQ